MPCIGNSLDLEIEAMSGQIIVLDSWAKWPGAVDSKCSGLDHVLSTAKVRSRLGPESFSVPY